MSISSFNKLGGSGREILQVPYCLSPKSPLATADEAPRCIHTLRLVLSSQGPAFVTQPGFLCRAVRESPHPFFLRAHAPALDFWGPGRGFQHCAQGCQPLGPGGRCVLVGRLRDTASKAVTRVDSTPCFKNLGNQGHDPRVPPGEEGCVQEGAGVGEQRGAPATPRSQPHLGAHLCVSSRPQPYVSMTPFSLQAVTSRTPSGCFWCHGPQVSQSRPCEQPAWGPRANQVGGRLETRPPRHGGFLWTPAQLTLYLGTPHQSTSGQGETM